MGNVEFPIFTAFHPQVPLRFTWGLPGALDKDCSKAQIDSGYSNFIRCIEQLL